MVKSSDQIGLFPDTPFIPEWKRSRAFDPELAERYRVDAMASTASSTAHQQLLDQLRPALVKVALSRSDRCVTADDAAKWMVDRGLLPGALGNAAGSLFRSSDWELVGYRPSERVSRHRNRVGIWRLKETRGKWQT